MNSDQMLAMLQQDYGTSRFKNQWQKQDWCYWDTVYVPSAGTAELQFFAVPAGGADPNRPAATITKTTEQTNLDQSGQIGGAECFIPMSLHFDLFPAIKNRQQDATVVAQTTFAADQLLAARWLQGMSQKGVFQWEINRNTWMIEAQPWRLFPPGFGLGQVFPPVIAGVAAPINGGSNAYVAMSPYSIYSMGDIFSLDQPVFLAPNTPFTWKAAFPEGISLVTTGMYNGDGTTHAKTGTFFAYAEMRGIKVRPPQ